MDLSKHAIDFCVKNWLDLIFDGVLWQKEVVESLESYIQSIWAEFVHIYLNAPKDIRQKRLEKRGIWWSLTLEKAICFYDNLVELNQELDMKEIDTTIMTPDDVCVNILEFVRQSWKE